MGADLPRARAVKLTLAERLRTTPEVNGVGLTRHSDGWAVKVDLVRPAPHLDLPPEVDGVAIHVEVTGPIVAR